MLTGYLSLVLSPDQIGDQRHQLLCFGGWLTQGSPPSRLHRPYGDSCIYRRLDFHCEKKYPVSPPFFLHLRSVQIKPLADAPWFVPSSEARVLLPGERTSRDGKVISNRILLSLPDAEFEWLRPFLTFQDLPRNTILHDPGNRLEYVHFPNRGLVSIVVATREGKTVEVGVVGNEGLVGTAALVGLDRSPHRAIVQIAGDGLRLRVDAVQSVLRSNTFLQHISSLHAVIQGMQAAQSAACNRLHAVEQRLARSLLIMQDRVDRASLPVTHDFLATMLGTDRPSVSLAAGVLHKKGAIEYTRGTVRIINRERLEEAACECYAVMREFDGPLGLR
jgi:CRP-like cAMP-binding protein